MKTGLGSSHNTFTDPFENHDFNWLFNEFYTVLCRYGMKFVSDKNVAEDIVQDLFLHLWEIRERLAAITNIKSYLFTAIKNRCLNHLKMQFPANIKADDLTELHIKINLPGPEELLESKELERIIEKGMKALPVKCRTIFIMKKFGDLSNKEVAEKLNISIKTVETQMKIAFRKLTAFISSHWNMVIPMLINSLFFFK